MIRFLLGTLLGAFTGYVLAALRADVDTEKATSFGLRAIEDVEDFEVERRTRPPEPFGGVNVIPHEHGWRKAGVFELCVECGTVRSAWAVQS